MEKDRLPFGVLVLLGLLAALPIAVFLLIKGICVVVAKSRANEAVIREVEAAKAQAAAPRVERRQKRSGSHFWETFAAWNAYCYEENQYYDRLHRGIY